MGQVYFKLMRLGTFQTIEKRPCDTLSVGQADAGRIKAAKKEPHRLPDVVSFTDEIDFYL